MRLRTAALWAATAVSGCLVPALDADRELPAAAGGASASGGNGGGASASGGSGGSNTAKGGSGGAPAGGSDQGEAGSGASGASTAEGGTGTSAAGGSSGVGGGGGDNATSGGGGAIGAAGSPGVAGSGGGDSGPITVEEFAGIANEYGFAWKNSFIIVPCYMVSLYNCATVPTGTSCGAGQVFKERFTMGGTPGTNYDVTFTLNGIVEAKYYSGGTRRAGADYSNPDAAQGTDTFYTGGSANASAYDSFKLTVFESDGVTEVQHYWLNSFPQASGFESHRTFPIGYEATIEVPGGGVIEYQENDPNCQSINNCGAGVHDDATCPAPRTVPNEIVAVPASYGGVATSTLNVVSGQADPWHAQMIHITVTGVVAK